MTASKFVRASLRHDWQFATHKLAALLAHRTQHRSTARWILGKPRVDRILALETFRQAWGRPIDSPPADDILADLDID